MQTRTLKERIIQTAAFEVIGIALVTPLFMLATGQHGSESLKLMLAISIAVMIWAPLYGFVFDAVELRRTGRVASDRPHGVRALHAFLYEVSSISMTLPMAMLIGGLTFGQAVGMNVGLTVFYIVYAYGFFLAYDRLRPVAVQ